MTSECPQDGELGSVVAKITMLARDQGLHGAQQFARNWACNVGFMYMQNYFTYRDGDHGKNTDDPYWSSYALLLPSFQAPSPPPSCPHDPFLLTWDKFHHNIDGMLVCTHTNQFDNISMVVLLQDVSFFQELSPCASIYCLFAGLHSNCCTIFCSGPSEDISKMTLQCYNHQKEVEISRYHKFSVVMCFVLVSLNTFQRWSKILRVYLKRKIL